MRVSWKKREEQGATLVEFALTFLLLMTLIMGIVEFGRAFHIYQALTNAAREGSRFGVAPFPGTDTLPDSGAIQTRVQTYLISANIPSPTVSVDQAVTNTINTIPMVHTRVQISAPYDFIFFPFPTITITARAEMRNENQ